MPTSKELTMKRLVLLALALVLALPAAALAKGPSKASIDGPGLDRAIAIPGSEDSGTPLGDLTHAAGFFPAVFRQTPDPMLNSRPKGDLGPKYTITYVVPGPTSRTDTIRQDVYPYAKPTPVTYMAPGQSVFGTERTRGGWYRATDQLRVTLVDVGLPATATAAGSSNARDWSPPVWLAALAAMLLAVTAGALVVRRRAGAAPAH